MSDKTLKSVNLNMLVYFQALVEESHISRAAKRVGMSQPGMSLALRELRTIFNDPILVPGQKGLIPSQKALGLLNKINQGLQSLESAIYQATDFDPKISNLQFRIIMSDYAAAALIPEMMKRLNREAPGIRIELLTWDKINDPIIVDQIDLIVGPLNKAAPRHFLQKVLFEERGVCVVAKDHPRIKNSITLEQYLKEKHVAVSDEEAGGRLIDRVLADKSRQRNIIFTTPHFLSMPIIVSKTELIATTRFQNAKMFAEKFPIQILELPFDAPLGQTKYIWHKKTEDSDPHRWLRNIVTETAKLISD